MENGCQKIEYVEFIEFWTWEYIRRSKNQKELFASYVHRDNSTDGVDCVQIDIGDYILTIPGEDNFFYNDASSIIDDMINCCFLYKRPKTVSWAVAGEGFSRHYSYLVSQKNEKTEIDTVDSFHKEVNASYANIEKQLLVNHDIGDRVIVFNIYDDIRILEAYIKKEQVMHYIKSQGEDAIIPSETLDKVLSLHEELKKTIVMRDKNLIGRWKNDEQRAIGLWLYDYCTNNNCGGPTAFAALRKTQYLECLGFLKEKENDRSLERWLAGTKSCIEAADVLPLTG